MIARAVLAIAIASSVAACGGGIATDAPGKVAATTPVTTPRYTLDCVADSAEPGALPAEAGVSYSTMVVESRLRDYRLFEPPGLGMSAPVPPVVVLPGRTID